MYRALVTALLLVTLNGCAILTETFTKPTGRICLDHQQFVNEYAVVKVLYGRLRANFQGTPDELREIDRAAHALSIKIEAKIAVPEAELDKDAIKELLSALISLVP